MINDIEYFKRQVEKSLSLPTSTLETSHLMKDDDYLNMVKFDYWLNRYTKEFKNKICRICFKRLSYVQSRGKNGRRNKYNKKMKIYLTS